MSVQVTRYNTWKFSSYEMMCHSFQIIRATQWKSTVYPCIFYFLEFILH